MVDNIENPTGPGPDSDSFTRANAAQEALRQQEEIQEQSADIRRYEADSRNRERSLGEKLTGRNKATEAGIAMEEADVDNDEFDAEKAKEAGVQKEQEESDRAERKEIADKRGELEAENREVLSQLHELDRQIREIESQTQKGVEGGRDTYVEGGDSHSTDYVSNQKERVRKINEQADPLRARNREIVTKLKELR